MSIGERVPVVPPRRPGATGPNHHSGPTPSLLFQMRDVARARRR